ncbi:MAG: pyridoxamine 5-phosphate oxidase [Acidimicrobiaceae bacterium]|nr:pyridoxamine 5-phosphate oxidase [Acidimicrobiaceae bacterium]
MVAVLPSCGQHGDVTDERALDLADIDADPIVQFQGWFEDAVAAEVPEPEAMCVATVGADGTPSARMVLLKQVDRRGFVFYTNYRSRKGEDLQGDPRAALVWRWFPLERQVRVTGAAEVVSSAESDAYFATRPRGAQIGAWASHQSQVLSDRDELEGRVAEVTARFGDGPIPRPHWWGGIRVVPDTVEFWQGRTSRLHDRLRYRRGGAEGGDGAEGRGGAGWTVERLAP